MTSGSLGEQVALVSGGGRGTGRAIAVGLASEGARVALLGRTPEPLMSAGDACTEAGAPAALAVPTDVTDPAAVRMALERVEQELGPVTLLVANAGQREPVAGPLWEVDPDAWWQVVETNLRGVFLLDRGVVPGMVARGGGRVLHVGSGLGQHPHPDWSAYSVSKAALTRLTEVLARSLDGTGVTVLEASPGLVRTEMTEDMWGSPEEQLWHPADLMVRAVVRFARGELDALHGRFVHAARDDLDRLITMADELRDNDLRTVRLRPYGPDDPLG